MSIVSADFQCTYISEGEQYLTDLMCATSDLIQRYTGTAANPNIPNEYNYTITKPVLQVLFSSASPGMTETMLKEKLVSQTWYINGAEISFYSTGADKDLSAQLGDFDKGTFKRIEVGNAQYPFGGIQFLKNLIKGLGGVNGVMKCVLKFEDNSGSVITKEHTCTLGARMVAADANYAEVYPDVSLILDAETATTLLHARLFKGASLLFDSATSTAKTVRWYTYDDAAEDWAEVPKTGATDLAYGGNGGKELVVGRDAVPTYLVVMAAIFNDASSSDYHNAEAIAYARVNDKTDSLFIQENATPADRVLRAGETTPAGVTFKPKVYDKNTSQQITNVKFKFVCFSPAGTILNGAPSGSPGASGGFDSNGNNIADNSELLTEYTVPRAMFEAINDGPRVLINAFKV